MGISFDDVRKNAEIVNTNVCSRGFGVGALFPENEDLVERVVFLCHQNETLPLEAKATFYTTHENQPRIHVAVYEQGGPAESDQTENNTVIREGDITGIPPGHPKGTPITVIMCMDTDGTIRMSAYHPAKPEEPLTLEARGRAEQPEKVQEARMLVGGTNRRD